MVVPNFNPSEWFADVVRDLRSRGNVEASLEETCRLAVGVIDGCEWAGVSLAVRQGRIDTPAATDDVVHKIHQLQNEVTEGPCLDAIWDEHLVQANDLGREPRWPQFASRATGLGLRSVLCIHLFTQGDTLASLNLYSDQAHAFDADTRDAGLIFASHVAVDLAAAQEHAELAQALLTRQRIGEACGILAERHDLTTHAAFTLLARTSQNHNVKLRDLASRLVTSEDGSRPVRSSDSSGQPGDGPH